MMTLITTREREHDETEEEESPSICICNSLSPCFNKTVSVQFVLQTVYFYAMRRGGVSDV